MSFVVLKPGFRDSGFEKWPGSRNLNLLSLSEKYPIYLTFSHFGEVFAFSIISKNDEQLKMCGLHLRLGVYQQLFWGLQQHELIRLVAEPSSRSKSRLHPSLNGDEYPFQK